jgi:hypothetical protein
VQELRAVIDDRQRGELGDRDDRHRAESAPTTWRSPSRSAQPPMPMPFAVREWPLGGSLSS